jgi:L-aminopeptidase/D-esterase-like protein
MSLRPGPRNLITDVPGLKVGQATDDKVRTGVTVILPDQAAVGACDVRGGGPGTRETDLLEAHVLVEAVDAVVLSGGSMYGLAAADGVAAALGAQGRGYFMGESIPRAPIVPAAILFDMGNGGDKAWGLEPPYRKLGMQALANAALSFDLGTAGGGAGAMAGQLKGGTGSASLVDDADGLAVGAVVCANSIGSAVMPGTKAFWAWPYEIAGEFGGVRPDALNMPDLDPDDWGLAKGGPPPGATGLRQNTTIACVATNVALTPAQAKRLAIMAQDGLTRAFRPIHTLFDGDVVFALSTGQIPLGETWARNLTRLGELAANCVARASARAVHEAAPWPGTPVRAWRDL